MSRRNTMNTEQIVATWEVYLDMISQQWENKMDGILQGVRIVPIEEALNNLSKEDLIDIISGYRQDDKQRELDALDASIEQRVLSIADRLDIIAEQIEAISKQLNGE